MRGCLSWSPGLQHPCQEWTQARPWKCLLSRRCCAPTASKNGQRVPFWRGRLPEAPSPHPRRLQTAQPVRQAQVLERRRQPVRWPCHPLRRPHRSGQSQPPLEPRLPRPHTTPPTCHLQGQGLQSPPCPSQFRRWDRRPPLRSRHPRQVWCCGFRHTFAHFGQENVNDGHER